MSAYLVCYGQLRVIIVPWLLEAAVACVDLTCMRITEKMDSGLKFFLLCVCV